MLKRIKDNHKESLLFLLFIMLLLLMEIYFIQSKGILVLLILRKKTCTIDLVVNRFFPSLYTQFPYIE